MSEDPFNRNKTKEAKLGSLITEIGEQNKRDAIHIAVVPVTASDEHSPGQHVGVTPDGLYSTETDPVGIVDPFIKHKINKGDIFWLCLYQGQVTTLRHEWTHPAFPVIHETEPAEKAKSDRSKSVSWLQQYAKRVNSHLSHDGDLAYQTLMKDIRNGSITYHGTDMHCMGDLEDSEDLRYHAQIVLGKVINWGDFEFGCTC